jgi:hypothetical protein
MLHARTGPVERQITNNRATTTTAKTSVVKPIQPRTHFQITPNFPVVLPLSRAVCASAILSEV